jgi:chromosome segregation ATPase
MKTLIIGLMAVFMLSAFSAMVLAEEVTDEPNLIATENSTIDQATANAINDELNESASVIDTTLARIGIGFTFNQEKKAEKELKLARLELIMAKIAAKNNNTEAMEKALEAHERIIARVQERINALDGKATKEGIKKSAEKLVGLERAIEVHEARIAKLNEILVSANLTEEQIANIQARLEKAENSTAHLKEVQAAKIDKLKTKLKAVANMTEEQAEAEIQKIEDAQNLSAVKKKVAEVKAARNENAAKVISEVIAKLEARQNETGKNASNAIEKLTIVQEKLQEKSEQIREKAGKMREETEENNTEEEQPKAESGDLEEN